MFSASVGRAGPQAQIVFERFTLTGNRADGKVKSDWRLSDEAFAVTLQDPRRTEEDTTR